LIALKAAGASPRLLAVMGSGETSPTMVATHRELFGRLGEEAAAVLLETTYAFQENKAEISAKAKRYFGDSVGRRVEILRDLGADADAMAAETALARLRAARWAFAGPGSPSYALDRWRGTQVPSALAELLQRGGCAVFASAAACTIGTRALPVYEIYKCGQPPPGWRDWTWSRPPACGSRSSPTTTTPKAAPTTPATATWASGACASWRTSSPTTPRSSASTSTPPPCSTSTPRS
jgi:hypothetical protein